MNRIQQVLDKLKERIPDFEVRKEQLIMIENVYKAMLEGLKSAIHAPTGTGKSLGYLIPYIAIKLDNPDYSIAINTFTISLQEQLKEDVELMNSIYLEIKKEEMEKKSLLGKIEPFIFYIMKGKSNYFCHLKFEEAKKGSKIPQVTIDNISRNLNHIEKKGLSYDLQNFSYRFSSKEWNLVQVENCKNHKCPFKDNCSFFEHNYNKKVDILVLNHSLFFTKYYINPEAWDNIDFYIFDEAHKLEKVILESSTSVLSMDILQNLAIQGASIAKKYGYDSEEVKHFLNSYFYQNPTILTLKNGIDYINQKREDSAIAFHKMNFSSNGFKMVLNQLLQWKTDIVESIKDFDMPRTGEMKEFEEDIKFWEQNLNEISVFNHMLDLEGISTLLWVEENKWGQLELKLTYKDFKDISLPFDDKGFLMTSGTLAQNNSCSSFTKRLYIDLDIDKVLPTPFNLQDQTLVYVSDSINPYIKNYEEILEEEIWNLIVSGNLKTFILFTSVELMNKIYENLEYRIKNLAIDVGEPIEIWVQDRNNFSKVLESFKNSFNKSILFGTYTYFEGVNLKGDSLTQIILTRLPYSVPTYPLQEILDARDNFSKWEAIIRFEQAFGRLIRTNQDFGTFSILDNRVYKHKEFLNLFNDEKVQITNNIEDIQNFYIKKNEASDIHNE